MKEELKKTGLFFDDNVALPDSLLKDTILQMMGDPNIVKKIDLNPLEYDGNETITVSGTVTFEPQTYIVIDFIIDDGDRDAG